MRSSNRPLSLTLAAAFRSPRHWQPLNAIRRLRLAASNCQGPLEVEPTLQRVVMAAEELPGRDEGLVGRRPVGASVAKWKFKRANAPADLPLTTLARMTARRWPVGTAIEECKNELGWDHHEVRGQVG